ncbi:MAG: hypothetical protein R2764_05390 [Bacteroidales bacterium]
MQQCYCGGFVEFLEGQNSMVLTACQKCELAGPADNINPYGLVYDEWEEIITNGISHIYTHAEFNLHVMASLLGEYPNGDLIFADGNNDNEISIIETMSFNEANNTRYLLTGTENPVWSDFSGIGDFISLKYPTLLHVDLDGVDETFSYRGIIGISKNIHVTESNQLNFMDNSIVSLLNESELIVDENATLVLEDNVTIHSEDGIGNVVVNGNLTIGSSLNMASEEGGEINLIINEGSSLVIEDNTILHAKAGICKIVINGDFTIGSNVSFLADEGAQIQLVIDNPGPASTINSAVFERGLLQSNQASLNLNSCSFDVAGGVEFSAGNLVVNGCQFYGASLYAANGADINKKVTVYNQSSFTGADGYAAHLSQYPNFYIHQNQFELNSNGIGLFHCGSGRLNRVSDNLIEDNGIGIVVYH